MDMTLFQPLLIRAASALLLASSLFVLFTRRSKAVRRPQDAPHGLPLVGHAIAFSRDMAGFSTRLHEKVKGIPVRLRLIVMDNILLSAPRHIQALARRSSELTNGPYRKFVSSTFGVPRDFQAFWAADNSGLGRVPRPGSTVAPHHRVDYLMHSLLVEFLTGKALNSLAARFSRNLETRLQAVTRNKNQWVRPREKSLYDFVKTHMFHASAQSIFGTHLFELEPDFCEKFWEFESALPELAKGLPRWMYPKQYRARDACLDTVRRWHANLQKRRLADPETFRALEQQDYDDFFGSGVVKKRHAAFAKMEVMGVNASASEDLALIWGTNSNATHAAFWMIHAILSDGTLQKRFLAEIQTAGRRAPGSDFTTYDMQRLCGNAFLESLYAETLRMYVANIVLRSPRSVDMNVGGWTARKGEILAAMSYPLHHDEAYFNVGTPEDAHPLTTFWAERFLVPAVDAVQDQSQNQTGCPDGVAPVKFSLAGTEGAFIPYGFGSNKCPGRHFAKQEMLLFASTLIGNYQIQLLEGETAEIDWRFYGSGVLGPAGEQLFRMRRRRGR